MKYLEPLYRPPSEAGSLIFQVAYGCPRNTCLFCPMYKGVRYKERDIEEVLSEIEKASMTYPDTKRVFLADGDVMNLSFDILKRIFKSLNKNFSRLARVSMYSNGGSILNKTEEELKYLKEHKLFTLYLGLESGSDYVLSLVKKLDTVKDMIAAVRLAQSVGIRMSVMILLGLGGRHFSTKHAEETAEALNEMQPKFLAALRFIQAPGLPMYGEYEPVSEYESVDELCSIVEHLDLKNTVFRANHSSNPIPIAARFPKDKILLLNDLKQMLGSGQLDKNGPGFVPFTL